MIKKIIYLILLLSLTSYCGIYKPVDARKVPSQAKDRARQNVNEGKGISINNIIGGKNNTNYQFSSSNPMWRASLSIIDFLPLTTVDYSGGVIVTDWYNDGSNSNESIKITIRFLSNEIRSDSIKIIVHKKNCINSSNCKINTIKSNINQELHAKILQKASEFEKELKNQKK